MLNPLTIVMEAVAKENHLSLPQEISRYVSLTIVSADCSRDLLRPSTAVLPDRLELGLVAATSCSR